MNRFGKGTASAVPSRLRKQRDRRHQRFRFCPVARFFRGIVGGETNSGISLQNFWSSFDGLVPIPQRKIPTVVLIVDHPALKRPAAAFDAVVIDNSPTLARSTARTEIAVALNIAARQKRAKNIPRIHGGCHPLPRCRQLRAAVSGSSFPCSSTTFQSL